MNSHRLISLLTLMCLLGVGCAQQAANQQPQVEPILLTALTPARAEQWLVRGHTRQQQVLGMLGQPHGVSQVGDYQYWNYTDVRHDQVKQESNLVRLTLVFDSQAVLVDYDLQNNHFQKKN
ncbi:hypothetical protein CWE15_02560 [Aliidiomarina taiwanensis]|uniref:Lipoprotein SmpA/OmlA domain-containing protein n=1 Tax=Aliidiomarina taiwanensis TaxID=946228 RepID=A0A432X9H1_9GAMM|nr:outer membrane protein assembly factor BamE [Aliidiomarina taiwanensis]RUO44075.1 hypothetical protein CWE15_02560 [Aliidiomarina taiwanensis]